MCKALITVTPSPKVGTLNYLKWVGGGIEREVKGEHCQGGGGMGGRRKVKGQLALGAVATSVVRERTNKASALQTGGALPMGRCASPPLPPPEP